MDEISKNTVSGDGQMKNSSEISFLGNENAKTRILVVGNSITRHGPLAEIGWERDWGMAASEPEKDYVHRLFKMLSESGKCVFMRIRQCAFWERNFLKEDILSNYDGERDFKADIVVFRLGENVPKENHPYFADALEKFLKYLCKVNTKVVLTTCFWHYNEIDDDIRSFAKRIGVTATELGDLGDANDMKAIGLFWHEGVANHPGDKGMEIIAERIFNAIIKD